MQQGQTQYFCFISISNNISMIIEWVMIVLSVALIADAIRKFWKMRGSHNSHVTKIYVLVLLWWGTFVGGSLYGIGLYFFQIQDDNERMSDLTKYYFLIDWSNAFIIQSILLLVPYHWGKQITDLFSHVQRGSQVAIQEPQAYNGIEKKMYLTLKYYIYFRFVYLALPVSFVLFRDLDLILLIFKIMLGALLLDCVFITLSLIIGMVSLKTTKQLKQQIDEDEAKRMFNQYLMIILANTIRFGFDLFYVFSNVFSDVSSVSDTCPSEGQSDNFGIQLVVNICTSLLSHFLPIFIILRIYNLEEKPEEMCKSLIITTSDS